ncbi:valine--tRNA ligase [Sphingomonas sp.]|jgi:valyl-tRNA synthetase|uniref:valine--tRNA ligase n=1 Tax=Sphingomonas sp. TaxID=28214 RepID=UPI002E380EAA|nr:valine--tRNA ligase [Sphingomonas sp.]HEX4693413.1 valine--tRNA ligase [Sphingomonas sp.]
MTELPKTFDPAEIERRWYTHWESSGQFRPDRPGAEPWTIVNPPPNVTGSLHIGHALDNTLQDILVRHARLQGKDVLWVVGTDHAGIATQMVVERQMAERQEKRTDFTRDEFVAKVWDWKRESGGEITQQLRRLGCSMDWANERFTMDEGFSKAVLKVFVDLYNQGLIYRDKRLVNWDPGLGTAISDLEVETREVKGSFWQIRYPLADGSGSVTVATTRPETMLADMAVAVHPDDERYKAMIGKEVRLPITGRLIRVIPDEHADPSLGTGAVKITPGHDFNDFEVGKRAGFKAGEMLNMLDAKAQVTQTADGLIPDDLIGIDRFWGRKQVVERLKEGGFLVPYVDKEGVEHDAEPRTIQTPYGDRSGEVIEPWLTDQWYVDAETLAKGPIEAVKSGAIKIVPKSWEKTFFNWMENIQPWCVSRQLWWGHRIPAWSSAGNPQNGEPERTYVGMDEAHVRTLAAADAGGREIVFADSWEEVSDIDVLKGSIYHDDSYVLVRDPDVLDTWFSSALWPFATMGWPDDGEWQHRYPNDVLISGFDILFFWDARMMMMGMHFMKDVPFRTLYLHGLVRAADGQKMSKSKGNVVNPLGLIDRYGADALRFFMAAMESQGRDIKMDEKRVEGYRNFATKLWNAARFCQSNGIGASKTLEAPEATLAVNKWIIGETIQTVQAVDLALADYRFDEAANAIYQFAWSRFCDWYLELIKPTLTEDAQIYPQYADETRLIAGWVLDQILVMLHPFMPFVTEELWSKLGTRGNDLIVAKWPVVDATAIDPAAIADIDWRIRLISSVRGAKNELGIAPGTMLTAYVCDASADTQNRINTAYTALRKLARLQDVHNGEPPIGAALQLVIDEATFVIPLEGVIDVAAERARLTKAIEAASKERDSLAGRLNNPSFVERAKLEAVEKARADHAEKTAEAERLSAALARLG